MSVYLKIHKSTKNNKFAKVINTYTSLYQGASPSELWAMKPKCTISTNNKPKLGSEDQVHKKLTFGKETPRRPESQDSSKWSTCTNTKIEIKLQQFLQNYHKFVAYTKPRKPKIKITT